MNVLINLFSDLDSVSLPGMEKLVSKTRAKQEQKFKDRMERRKKAKLEGKNLQEIEAEEKREDEEEGGVKNGSDVLKDLQVGFIGIYDLIGCCDVWLVETTMSLLFVHVFIN